MGKPERFTPLPPPDKLVKVLEEVDVALRAHKLSFLEFHGFLGKLRHLVSILTTRLDLFSPLNACIWRDQILVGLGRKSEAILNLVDLHYLQVDKAAWPNPISDDNIQSTLL